jgi:hypothetical protein
VPFVHLKVFQNHFVLIVHRAVVLAMFHWVNPEKIIFIGEPGVFKTAAL